MTDWMRRNRWPLILLVPVILLAIAAHSFRFWQVYLPWMADVTREVAVAVVTAEHSFVTHPDGVGTTLEAHFTPVQVEEIGEELPADPTDIFSSSVQAAPGATLWRLTVDVEADVDLAFGSCELALADAERIEYSAMAGQLEDGMAGLAPGAYCAPLLQSGPTGDFEGNYVPADPESARPAAYSLEYLYALPEGVAPTHMRLSVGHGADQLVRIP